MKKILTSIFLAASLSAAAQMQNDVIQVGQKAPELAFASPSGETLKLSELTKGHFVLVDFWASWCGPCRRSNPGLVELYNDYKDKHFKSAKKGFIILSVSLDQNKDAWVNAIAKDKLAWPYHISDLGGWQSKAAELYGVQFIPQAFLVGPDGKVVAKYNTSEEAKADLERLSNSDKAKATATTSFEEKQK